MATSCLEGDNLYFDEYDGCKKDAKITLKFRKLPPILLIQLKRFDISKEQRGVKINSFLEYPDILNLKLPKENSIFSLYSVIVHRGDTVSGHYFSYLKLFINKKERWVKFDDEQVSEVTNNEVFNANYGIHENQLINSFSKRNENAYILIYVKETQKDKIFNKNFAHASFENKSKYILN